MGTCFVQMEQSLLIYWCRWWKFEICLHTKIFAKRSVMLLEFLAKVQKSTFPAINYCTVLRYKYKKPKLQCKTISRNSLQEPYPCLLMVPPSAILARAGQQQFYLKPSLSPHLRIQWTFLSTHRYGTYH